MSHNLDGHEEIPKHEMIHDYTLGDKIKINCYGCKKRLLELHLTMYGFVSVMRLDCKHCKSIGIITDMETYFETKNKLGV